MDEEYIDKEGQGDLVAMTPTIVDMLGVFFLKVVIMMILTPTIGMMIIMVMLNDLRHRDHAWPLLSQGCNNNLLMTPTILRMHSILFLKVTINPQGHFLRS